VAAREITRDFTEPSLFWQELSRRHSDDLDRHGLAAVKRRQALRYFTWRWRWGGILRSRQLLFLLSHASPLTMLRCVLARPHTSSTGWRGVAWSRRERWLYVVSARLLWEYARRRDELGALALPEPRLGDPLPVRWRGRLISQDLANSALEANAIARTLGDTAPRSIVEVGAGYGRTAYVLLKLYPQAAYTVIDIEPALTISRWYLTSLFPRRYLRFLQPDAASLLGDRSADLVLSVSTLQEMRPDQVASYLGLFDRIARGGVVYLKQWGRWTNPVDDVTLAFDEYPVPRTWATAFRERAPVQTNFRHAAWRVPATRVRAPRAAGRSTGS
jgi:SAM-dependent methyltransferase